MVEDFDIGPLTWVKDEIDQALNSVLENFTSVLNNPDDVAPLKFSQTHLYQVSGALDMVGLEGCKRFCAEIEKLSGKLEKKTLAVTPENIEVLTQAVHALGAYLQDLLNGMPDVPLKLFPLLKSMADLQNELVDESELFFPDTSIRAPKDLPSQEFAESELPAYFQEQRGNFQKSLLNWLKSGGDDNLQGMRVAIENVLLVQGQAAGKALWWAVSAFVDAISDQQIAASNGVKKLCRRIDQQLKSMADGSARAAGNLLSDALYYVAISKANSELVKQVKSNFELYKFLPGSESVVTSADISPEEIERVAQFLAVVDKLKDSWTGFSNGDLESLQSFLSQISEVLETIELLSNSSVRTLFSSIHESASALDLDVSKVNENAFIEVAAGLNLLEDALKSYTKIDAGMHQKLLGQAAQIQAVIGGGPMADFAANAGNLDSNVLFAVAQQIKDALKKIEQALDAFFRNPENTAVLADVDKPIKQVIAAFDMLEMPLPADIARSSATLVEYFNSRPEFVSPKVFELVAESLSMLGFYVDDLPRVRPESYDALEQELTRLDEQIRSVQSSVSVETTTEETGQVVDFPSPKHELEVHGNLARAKPKFNVSVQVGVAKLPPHPVQPAIEVIAEKDRADDAELLDIYLTETEEVLASIAQHLQSLRINLTDREALTEVRRGFHTLKGSGRTVGLKLLGQTAGAVEALMNVVLDSKFSVTPAILNFVESVSAAFANWAAELRAQGEVVVNSGEWIAKAVALEEELNQQKPAALPEELLIDGTHKISRGLFNIFITEAQQHMETLQEAVAALSAGAQEKPSNESRRAAHTLASNAGTAGFKSMGDLSRALEHWLDAHSGAWSEEALALYQNVVEALSKMLAKALELKQPKQSTGLLNALKEAIVAQESQQTESIDMDFALPAELMVAGEGEPLPAIDDISAPTVTNIDFDLPELVEAQQESEPELVVNAAPEKPVPAPVQDKNAVKAADDSAKHTSVDQELLSMFIEEAKELVPQVGNALRSWRADPQEADYPDALQRALHTLKGSARMANQATLGDTIHGLEDRVIKVLKSNKPTATDFDDMFAELDQIGVLLEDTVGLNAGGRGAVAVPGRAANRRTQYMRLRADVLDRLINEAGEISIARSRMDREMQGFKQFSMDLTESVMRLRNYLRELEIEAESQLQSRMTHLQETNETFDPLEFDRFTRLQELTRMMAESVNDVSTIQMGLLTNLDETDAALQQQNRMNRELQHGLMNVRMVPFSLVSERLQRIVRQTSRELDKPVEMLIDGEDVEIDRSVLDKIGAPLEHLLRNAVAHGIESKAQRKKAGKANQGSITLKVRHESDEIVLTVTDDGGGIDLSRVREKAIENGLFSVDQHLTEQELLSVIFEPGFSTATEVTQIAGRGVGLDSVRSDITALGGRIDVNNASGHGAVFSIYLPVTLSVAQVVTVRVGSQVFALPSVMVEQVQKLKPAVLAAAYESQLVVWSGRNYPIHFLSRLIGDSVHIPEPQAYTPVLLLRSGTYQIALHVDEIVGNQEVVMKPIGPQLARVPGMIGATVLGDGNIVLMINAVQLANREFLSVGSVKVSHTPAEVIVENVAPVIMVVDDSLTMRKVLSRLLEREGYTVLVAKDGMDALQLLQDNQPDIILTDIEMPRMDGFEFSRNVRADSKTANIPIVVISSRTAEKHRKLADEIGINAYLGKPVQDDELINQVNLLLGQSAPATAS